MVISYSGANPVENPLMRLAQLIFHRTNFVVIGILVLLCANTVELPFPLNRSTLS